MASWTQFWSGPLAATCYTFFIHIFVLYLIKSLKHATPRKRFYIQSVNTHLNSPTLLDFHSLNPAPPAPHWHVLPPVAPLYPAAIRTLDHLLLLRLLAVISCFCLFVLLDWHAWSSVALVLQGVLVIHNVLRRFIQRSFRAAFCSTTAALEAGDVSSIRWRSLSSPLWRKREALTLFCMPRQSSSCFWQFFCIG